MKARTSEQNPLQYFGYKAYELEKIYSFALMVLETCYNDPRTQRIIYTDEHKKQHKYKIVKIEKGVEVIIKNMSFYQIYTEELNIIIIKTDFWGDIDGKLIFHLNGDYSFIPSE